MWRIWTGFIVGASFVFGLDFINYLLLRSGWIELQFRHWSWGALKGSRYLGHGVVGLDLQHLSWWNQASLPVALVWGVLGALAGFTFDRGVVRRREHQEMADDMAQRKKNVVGH
jgi:hypothetical protein